MLEGLRKVARKIKPTKGFSETQKNNFKQKIIDWAGNQEPKVTLSNDKHAWDEFNRQLNQAYGIIDTQRLRGLCDNALVHVFTPILKTDGSKQLDKDATSKRNNKLFYDLTAGLEDNLSGHELIDRIIEGSLADDRINGIKTKIKEWADIYAPELNLPPIEDNGKWQIIDALLHNQPISKVTPKWIAKTLLSKDNLNGLCGTEFPRKKLVKDFQLTKMKFMPAGKKRKVSRAGKVRRSKKTGNDLVAEIEDIQLTRALKKEDQEIILNKIKEWFDAVAPNVGVPPTNNPKWTEIKDTLAQKPANEVTGGWIATSLLTGGKLNRLIGKGDNDAEMIRKRIVLFPTLKINDGGDYRDQKGRKLAKSIGKVVVPLTKDDQNAILQKIKDWCDINAPTMKLREITDDVWNEIKDELNRKTADDITCNWLATKLLTLDRLKTLKKAGAIDIDEATKNRLFVDLKIDDGGDYKDQHSHELAHNIDTIVVPLTEADQNAILQKINDWCVINAPTMDVPAIDKPKWKTIKDILASKEANKVTGQWIAETLLTKDNLNTLRAEGAPEVDEAKQNALIATLKINVGGDYRDKKGRKLAKSIGKVVVPLTEADQNAILQKIKEWFDINAPTMKLREITNDVWNDIKDELKRKTANDITGNWLADLLTLDRLKTLKRADAVDIDNATKNRLFVDLKIDDGGDYKDQHSHELAHNIDTIVVPLTEADQNAILQKINDWCVINAPTMDVPAIDKPKWKTIKDILASKEANKVTGQWIAETLLTKDNLNTLRAEGAPEVDEAKQNALIATLKINVGGDYRDKKGRKLAKSIGKVVVPLTEADQNAILQKIKEWFDINAPTMKLREITNDVWNDIKDELKRKTANDITGNWLATNLLTLDRLKTLKRADAVDIDNATKNRLFVDLKINDGGDYKNQRSHKLALNINDIVVPLPEADKTTLLNKIKEWCDANNVAVPQNLTDNPWPTFRKILDDTTTDQIDGKWLAIEFLSLPHLNQLAGEPDKINEEKQTQLIAIFKINVGGDYRTEKGSTLADHIKDVVVPLTETDQNTILQKIKEWCDIQAHDMDVPDIDDARWEVIKNALRDRPAHKVTGEWIATLLEPRLNSLKGRHASAGDFPKIDLIAGLRINDGGDNRNKKGHELADHIRTVVVPLTAEDQTHIKQKILQWATAHANNMKVPNIGDNNQWRAINDALAKQPANRVTVDWIAGTLLSQDNLNALKGDDAAAANAFPRDDLLQRLTLNAGGTIYAAAPQPQDHDLAEQLNTLTVNTLVDDDQNKILQKIKDWCDIQAPTMKVPAIINDDGTLNPKWKTIKDALAGKEANNVTGQWISETLLTKDNLNTLRADGTPEVDESKQNALITALKINPAGTDAAANPAGEYREHSHHTLAQEISTIKIDWPECLINPERADIIVDALIRGAKMAGKDSARCDRNYLIDLFQGKDFTHDAIRQTVKNLAGDNIAQLDNLSKTNAIAYLNLDTAPGNLTDHLNNLGKFTGEDDPRIEEIIKVIIAKASANKKDLGIEEDINKLKSADDEQWKNLKVALATCDCNPKAIIKILNDNPGLKLPAGLDVNKIAGEHILNLNAVNAPLFNGRNNWLSQLASQARQNRNGIFPPPAMRAAATAVKTKMETGGAVNAEIDFDLFKTKLKEYIVADADATAETFIKQCKVTKKDGSSTNITFADTTPMDSIDKKETQSIEMTLHGTYHRDEDHEEERIITHHVNPKENSKYKAGDFTISHPDDDTTIIQALQIIAAGTPENKKQQVRLYTQGKAKFKKGKSNPDGLDEISEVARIYAIAKYLGMEVIPSEDLDEARCILPAGQRALIEDYISKLEGEDAALDAGARHGCRP